MCEKRLLLPRKLRLQVPFSKRLFGNFVLERAELTRFLKGRCY
ncbi:hypothetical protein NRI_0153 [Neorickettsia risticii str. Illinois]|uniref:Uncharacterized protein n=1 Tax=Neorickettsia risticii (strain Illinois) TaxID=434131 RepID=C6V431_NEORI|nr:hypothetical protein NRI_0153 [Neorickettsia risticii str. Illinois]